MLRKDGIRSKVGGCENLLPEPSSPSHQSLQQLLDGLPRLGVGHSAGLVYLLLSKRHHDLRPADRMHVQEDEALSQIILGPGGPQHPDGGPHQANRFAIEGIIPVGSRGPIDGLLQDPGDRTVPY